MKKAIHKSEKSSGSPFRSRGRDSLAVQAKLFVNQPGDQHEAEADKTAGRVVNGSSPTGASASGAPASVQLKPIAQTLTPTVQRKENLDQMGQLDMDGTEDKMGAINYKGPVIQRKEEDQPANDLLPPVENQGENTSQEVPIEDKIQETKGQGSPLSSDVKTEMETGFGADFKKVKIHTGTQAEEMSSSLGAQAFTTQDNIYFNTNKYSPSTTPGKFLLAHELTHTIQQGAAPVKQVVPDENPTTTKAGNTTLSIQEPVVKTPGPGMNTTSEVETSKPKKPKPKKKQIKTEKTKVAETTENSTIVKEEEVLPVISVVEPQLTQPVIIDNNTNDDSEDKKLTQEEIDANVNQLIANSVTDLKAEMPVVDETTETSTTNQHLDPQDASMRSSVRYNIELTPEQKDYFQWTSVLMAFRELPAHAKVSDYYLQQWARKQLNLGWSLGQIVPDLQSFRASYGEPQIYEVTKKQVPTLYVYEYAGNKSAVRNELLNKQNYDGFWIHVDSITGKKSVLQQRDSFAKYYDTHPIGPGDVQLVFKFLEVKGIKQSESTKTATKESATFRKAVERAQNLLFPGVVKGYGLLTPPTLVAIKNALKNAQVDKEKSFTGIGGEVKFRDVNNITGLAKDPEGISSETGEWQNGGVNLRSMPFTPEDPMVKKSAVSLSMVEKSIIEHLAFGTRMTILKETVAGSNGKDPGWYWVMTETGKEGYVAKHLVQTKLPAPDVRYHLVKEGETLLGIVRKYYSPDSEDRVGIVESGGEFRNYVLELARYNENWRGDEAGAVFKAGIDPNDPKSWKHTVVRKGLRMWIPSSAEMYYLIHKRPASQKFDNTNWAEDGGQWIIDNSPVTILINSYLDWWATIPQEQREKGVQKYYQQQLALYEKLQADWSWLDKYIAPLAPIVSGAGAVLSVSLIYDLYISFNIGYFDFLSKSDPKLLILNSERTLRNLTQLEHYKGIIQGFVQGLCDWGKDLVDSFAAIGEVIVTMADIITDPETYKKIADFAGDAFQYVMSNTDEIKKTFEDLNYMEVMTGLIGGMRSILNTKGKEMGRGAAQVLMKFAGGSPYEQGYSIGKIIGFLVPEIVLAVASEGIWVAVKGALKGMQLVSKILKPILKGIKVALSLLKKATTAAKDVIRFIKTFIKSILSKTKKGASKFWEKLEELFGGFHRFLKNKYDDALSSKNAGKVDVDDYADTNKSRLRDEVKKDLDPGDNYNERMEDAIKALAIIEMNDALDPSPPVVEVVTFLNATINLPKNDKFTSRHLNGNLYEISFNPKIPYSQGADKDNDFTDVVRRTDYGVSDYRRTHILEGHPPGTGHGPRRGNIEGVFPDTWTDDQVIEAVERIANGEKSTWKQSNGPGYNESPVTIGGYDVNAPDLTIKNKTPVRFKVQGFDHGVKIEVIVEPKGEGIITAYIK